MKSARQTNDASLPCQGHHGCLFAASAAGDWPLPAAPGGPAAPGAAQGTAPTFGAEQLQPSLCNALSPLFPYPLAGLSCAWP